MRVALDFDKTFTLAPELWTTIISLLTVEGHQVYIVTARDEIDDGIDWAAVGRTEAPCKVIWTDGVPKKDVIAALGLVIDVWIDDDPKSIFEGTSMSSRAELHQWRTTDEYRNSPVQPHGNSRGFLYKDAHQFEGTRT